MRSSVCLLTLLLLGWTACSEPGKRVVAQSTDEGAFRLTLDASKGWVRPNQWLPIQVALVSLDGPITDGLYEEIKFKVSNGSLDDDDLNLNNNLDVVLEPGYEDYPGATTYKAWIKFKANPSTSDRTESQGEIHAFFRDALATLKIRIGALPDDL